jgi:hypothetical protein
MPDTKNQNLANDDRQNPPISGEITRLLNRYPPPGSPAPVQPTPTTQSGKINTEAAKTSKPKPGRRTQNPLANFSSYTYQISLYMITPDAYDAFIESGRKNINAINNISAAGEQAITQANQQAATREAAINSGFVQGVGERGRTTSPPSPSAPTTIKKGGAFLVAQSGGINNTNSKRAPGFDLDFYIDNLRLDQAIGSKEVQGSTNVTSVKFDIIEPYGFSFLTKLREASNALLGMSNTANLKALTDPSRQCFILGFRFLGYDKDGYLIDPTKISGVDGDPQGNAFGLYERFYDIQINKINFKIDGKAVVYNLEGVALSSNIAFGTRHGVVWTGATVAGRTVYEALMGGSEVSGSQTNTTANTRTQRQGGNSIPIGLLAKLNGDEKKRYDTGKIGIPAEWDVVFLGEAETEIKNASLVSKADLDKRKWIPSEATKTAESNVNSEQLPPDSTIRQIQLGQGITILQAVNDIIKQSSYMEQALTTLYNVATEPDRDTNAPEEQVNKNPKELKWYTMHAEVRIKGYDIKQNDFVYKTTYIIQPYLTPAVLSSYASTVSSYYGPYKRYDYWFTGKNSEVISYTQELNNAFYNVTLQGTGIGENAPGGNANIPTKVGQPTGQDKTGKLNIGMEAQNSYMSSLYDPNSFASVKLNIIGDPDFLMQPAPSSINSLYNQFYGTDGYTINPNGGQTFVELCFKEPTDYKNSTGLMDINQSVYLWKNPEQIQRELDQRGGGIIIQVNNLVSTFKGGKFQQELTGTVPTFNDNQQANNTGDERTPVVSARDPNGAYRGDRAKVTPAPTSTGTGTTNVTGFGNSPPNTALNPAEKSQLTVGNFLNNFSYPMQRTTQNQTLTVPTKNGPTQDDDGGINYNYF